MFSTATFFGAVHQGRYVVSVPCTDDAADETGMAAVVFPILTEDQCQMVYSQDWRVRAEAAVMATCYARDAINLGLYGRIKTR